MNNFSRDIMSDIHILISKAKAFENQLQPLAELYTQVQGMTEQLESLHNKVLDIETNINKGGVCADDLRHILRDAFSYIVPNELLKFDVDAESIQDAFESNAESDVIIGDEVFEINHGNEICLDDYRLNYEDVRWGSVAEDINFDADFNEHELESLIDRIINKVCPSSQDVPSQPMEDCNAN